MTIHRNRCLSCTPKTVSLGLVALVCLFVAKGLASAAPTTNSWTGPNNDFWDVNSDWSLGTAPSITDGFDLITNATSKAVFIDSFDTSFFSNELTISNLTVAGSGGTTNTLNLTGMNAGGRIPLTILNGLTIGNSGRLQINNSMLQTYNGTFISGSILQFALGTNASPIVVNNNLALAGTLNVSDGGGFTNTTYTLFTYQGTLNYSGLILGTTPPNETCVISTNTIGEVNLVVSVPEPSTWALLAMGIGTLLAGLSSRWRVQG